MRVPLRLILVVAFCALLGSFGQILFKLGSKDLNSSILSFILNWKILVGLFFYALSAILFIYALKYGELSVLYPIIATSYIWVDVFSVLFLGENFGSYKFLGILLIIIGIYVIVR